MQKKFHFYLKFLQMKLKKLRKNFINFSFKRFCWIYCLKYNAREFQRYFRRSKWRITKRKIKPYSEKSFEYLDKETLIIASGGISTKSDVEERLDNGAKLIQVYTSFIYQGPSIINDLLN